MLNDLITYLNTLITAQGDFQKVRGLCEVVTPKGSTAAFPAEWSKEKNGYERATDFDKWDGSTYWRLTGPIGTNQVDSPVRALSDIERTYPLRLVCSMKRSLIPNAQNTAYAHDKLAWAVQKIFKDKEQNIKTELGARYVSMSWGSVNHDHAVIQSTELANIERLVGSGWVLITMDLAITVRMSRECIADFQDEVTAPTSLTATSGAASIDLAWTSALSEFWIYRSTDGIEWRKIGESATTSYSDTSAQEGSAYFYRVKGRSGGVLSSWSNIAGAQRFAASLTVDFTFSSTTIDDETTLTLTATGDSGDIYMWTDVVADEIIGEGSPLVIPNYKWGVNTRTIKLDVTSSSGAYGTVTKTDELTVTIKQVDDFITRVDAQIALTGGSYTSAQRFALDTYVHFCKWERPEFWPRFRGGNWFVMFPASLDVARLAFWEQVNYVDDLDYTDEGAILKYYNSPTLSGNLINTNGVDSYFILDIYYQNLCNMSRGLRMHYVGVSDTNALVYPYGWNVNASARGYYLWRTENDPHTVLSVESGTQSANLNLPTNDENPWCLAYATINDEIRSTEIDQILDSYFRIKRDGVAAVDENIGDNAANLVITGQTYPPHGAYGRIDNPDTATPTSFAATKWGGVQFMSGDLWSPEEVQVIQDAFCEMQTTLGR